MTAFLRTFLLLLLTTTLRAAPPATPAPTPAPTPIHTANIINEADRAIILLSGIRNTLASDQRAHELPQYIPSLAREIDANTEQTQLTLASPAPIGVLESLSTRWNVLLGAVKFRADRLTDQLNRLDNEYTQVESMTQTWEATAAAATTSGLPSDVLERISRVQSEITATGQTITEKRTEFLGYQSTLANQSTRITQTLANIDRARHAAVEGLFTRDSRPLWDILAPRTPSLRPDITPNPFTFRLHDTINYLVRERGRGLLLTGIGIGLYVLFRRVRRKVRKWTLVAPSLRRSTEIFDVPAANAALVVMLLTPIVFPDAPPLFNAVTGALIVLPLFAILQRILEKELRPITWALAGLYISAQLREANIPFAPRLIDLMEALAVILLALWIVHLSKFAADPDAGRNLLWRVVRAAAHTSLIIFALVGLANVLGYVNLSLYLGSITLDAAYLAVLLYAACHIVEGLVVFALHVPPLSMLAMVKHQRPVLERRVARFLRFVAALGWILFVLQKLFLLHPVISALRGGARFPIVADVTLGGLVTFFVTVWASFVLSRFVRFLLEEDVYDRISLKPGIPFAISTLLHYAIILLGFYLAMAALIGDVSKFTVLAGAFGVGIGFGLQNIVNNFVSSLIVLFERPVKIGDLIEIGPIQGTVKQIGIRATIIRTSLGSEIIVPNAKLISDPVTNWTLTNQHRIVQLDIVTAAADVDPEKVRTLLEETAKAQSGVMSIPPPEASLSKFSAATLTFELRAWTSDLPNTTTLRSELTIAITKALTRQGIAAG